MADHQRTVPEETLAGLLASRGLTFTEQEKIAGHKIDFIVEGPGFRRRVPVDVNGDRWHHWKKIVDCDRVKLQRVLDAEETPFGVWWSRLQREPEVVVDTIEELGRSPVRALPWWDWAVDLDSLTRGAQIHAQYLLDQWKREA